MILHWPNAYYCFFTICRYNNYTMIIKKKNIKVLTHFGEFECLFESNIPERGYTVTVPKLKGVVTCGENLNEAKKMAKEAIELHCECLLKYGLAEIKIYQHRIQRSKEYSHA